MISVDVRIVNEEVLLRLDKIPQKVRELVLEKFGTLINELRTKVEGGVARKLGKVYPEMFESGVTQVGSTTVGYVEFKPSDKSYLIRVGAKGILANPKEEFFSRRDVMHPPMKSESIQGTLTSVFAEEQPRIVESIEDAVFAATV